MTPLLERGKASGSTGGRYHRALHPYSSLRPEDLDLHVGDLVEFIAEVEPGWWRGRIEDRVGVFPNNYVSDPLHGESPVVLRRNSRVKSFHASIDQNLEAPLSGGLFLPEDEPSGPLFGSISSQLDWSTASLSSFKAKGFFGRVRQSLSTKSLFPKFLRRRLSNTSLNDKSSIESSSVRKRRNSFASFFHKSSGMLQAPPTPSPARADRWRRLTGFRLEEDVRRLSLSADKLRSTRPTEECKSWVWQQSSNPSSADSGVRDLDLEAHEEVFGPILEITDEVVEDMFDNKNDLSDKDLVIASPHTNDTSYNLRQSKIRTSFSPFEKTSRPSRPSIATNPNVVWKPKQSESEVKVTEL